VAQKTMLRATFVRLMSKYLHILATLSIMLSPFVSWAGNLTGRVSDEDGMGIPFVTVYIEGTTNGTTTNLDGDFVLSVPDGYAVVVFRYVGYKTTAKGVEVKGDTRLDCTLPKVVYQLGEVQVDGNEDPAYRIMRLARSRRKFYQEQVDEYSCRVYIKGINYVKNLPKKILGRSIEIDGLDATRSGIAYLSESVSEFHYKRPEFTKEKVIASKVAGNSQGFTWNNATSLHFNIYDKSYELEGLSGRDLISPLNPSATLYYRYVYKGFFMEDSVVVNRIGLVPRTTGIPLFHGDLFIQENTWRIHGADLYMTKESGIDFVDTIRMKVEFIPIAPDLWLQSNLTFDLKFNVKMLKMTGWGSFTAVFSKYNVRSYRRDVAQRRTNVTEEELAKAEKDDAKAAPPSPEKKKKKQESKAELEKLKEAAGDTTMKFDLGRFDKGPLVKVESEANDKDSAFWAEVRVIPLTEVEQRGYALKDSIEQVKETPAYIDSMDRKRNRFNWQNLFLGYRYRSTPKNLTVSVPATLTAVGFNTVEGYVIDLGPTVSWSQKKERWNLVGSANLRYGFASGTFYGKASLYHRFNAKDKMYVRAEGGHYVEQFSRDVLQPWVNSIYTVFFEENHMRLYRHSYGRVGWGRELINGLRVDASLYYGQRAELFNSTRLSGQFIEWRFRSYMPNRPENAGANPDRLNGGALLFGVNVRWRPGLKYFEYPDRKMNLGTPYPEFSLTYRRGLPWFGANSNFDQVELSIENDNRLGMLGTIEWKVEAGIFASNGFVQFADRRHFATSQVIIQRTDMGAFVGLPYYAASTDRYYAAAHVEHHFKGFILNKVPLIKKLKWDFLFLGHYLYTPDHGHYWEVGVSLENIFKVLRVDVAFPFRAEVPQNLAVRVRLGF
jgi:hypothetical protein